MKKLNTINFRISDIDFIFLKDLQSKNINVSEYIRLAIKMTPRYKNFYKIYQG